MKLLVLAGDFGEFARWIKSYFPGWTPHEVTNFVFIGPGPDATYKMQDYSRRTLYVMLPGFLMHGHPGTYAAYDVIAKKDFQRIEIVGMA